MSKGLRLVLGVLLAFLVISFLHVWANIGFDKFAFLAGRPAEENFRVGFLPVT